MFLVLGGLALLRPTVIFVVACALGGGFLMVQARLEEWDRRQRCTLPGVHGTGAALHPSLSQQASRSTTGFVILEERRT